MEEANLDEILDDYKGADIGCKGKGGKDYWDGPSPYAIIKEVSRKHSHASVWKLYCGSRIIATLDEDGRILRTYK